MICSAQRTASAMALTVAGILVPPSYCASFRAGESPRDDQQKNSCRARSVDGLCCIATELFFANDGAVSRPRCRSKLAQKAPRACETPIRHNPRPGGQIPVAVLPEKTGRKGYAFRSFVDVTPGSRRATSLVQRSHA